MKKIDFNNFHMFKDFNIFKRAGKRMEYSCKIVYELIWKVHELKFSKTIDNEHKRIIAEKCISACVDIFEYRSNKTCSEKLSNMLNTALGIYYREDVYNDEDREYIFVRLSAILEFMKCLENYKSYKELLETVRVDIAE